MANEKILIIDDDQEIVEAMQTVLDSQGFQVDEANDPEAAMKKLEKSIPDLIILDVMMRTVQDGFVLSRKLKKDEKYKKIPILMLTGVKEKLGFDFKESAGDEEWLPVEAFLDKPVKPELLLEKINSLLKKK
jgi:CheY-like chemotaxis protein